MELQDFIIARFFVENDIVFGEVAIHVFRVFAPGMHIRKIQIHLVLMLVKPHILGVAGIRVALHPGQHAAHLRSRDNLMQQLGSQSARHELVMKRLIDRLQLVLRPVNDNTASGKRAQGHHVDLIKGNPVLHLILVTPEHRLRIMGKT
ncbi:hypothetical protein D3C75_823360 [compost metagenome]